MAAACTPFPLEGEGAHVRTSGPQFTPVLVPTLTIVVRVCQIKICHAHDHVPGTAPIVADQGGRVPEAEP